MQVRCSDGKNLLTSGPLTRVPCDLLFLHASVQGAVGVAPVNTVFDELTCTLKIGPSSGVSPSSIVMV